MTLIKPALAALAIIVLPVTALAQDAGRDLATEEANRTLVVDFYEQFFNAHETEDASEVIAEDYIQHNPGVPDGKEPFVSYFTGFFEENPDSTAELVRSAANGDLVRFHVHSTNWARPLSTSFVSRMA